MNYITGTKIIAVSRPDKRLNAFIQGGTISSFSLPAEITSIAPHAFDNISGLTEIVFNNQEEVVDVSENAGIGAGVKFVVPEQLLDGYEAQYPNRDVVSYETGYEWVIPFIGETTLTAAYVNQCLMQNPEAKKAHRVIVPVEFTAYESGSIQAIINAVTGMTNLVTCYEAGNIDLDMNGDIVAKIVEIGKTVDEALVYARSITYGEKDASFQNDLNLIIFPPFNNVHIGWNKFAGCTNLVYVAPIRSGDIDADGSWNAGSCSGANNLLYFDFTGSINNLRYSFFSCSSLKSLKLHQTNNLNLNYMQDQTFGGLSSLTEFIWENGISSFSISSSPLLTRQALLDMLDYLGTPETQQTIRVGATNFDKLLAEDIASFAAKNWNIVA